MKYFPSLELFRFYLYDMMLGFCFGIVYPLLGNIKNGFSLILKSSVTAIIKGDGKIQKSGEINIRTHPLFDFLFVLILGFFYFAILYAFHDFSFSFSSIALLFFAFLGGRKLSLISTQKIGNRVFIKTLCFYTRVLVFVFLPARLFVRVIINRLLVPIHLCFVRFFRKSKTKTKLRKKHNSYSIFLLTRAREYDNINI